MANADAIRWDQRYQRYASGESTPSFAPDDLLTTHAALFQGEGPALDVASGLGANALWLAEQGYETTAVDGSIVGLQLLAAEAKRRRLAVSCEVADLDDWQWPVDYHAVISVFRFLDRKLFDSIASALRPGGLLVYQTFNTNHLDRRPDFNREFVLADNELNDAFSSFEVIVNDQSAASTRYIARRPV